jgi:hypothetical protein
MRFSILKNLNKKIFFWCYLKALSRLDQAIQYQSMKNIPALGTENPSQMGQTHGAITNPPTIARKPGKLVGGGAGVAAPAHVSEATDIEDDPMRVGKGVPVRSLNSNTVIRSGDCLMALAAQYIFFVLRRLLLSFFFKDAGFARGTRFVGRDTQAMQITNAEL